MNLADAIRRAHGDAFTSAMTPPVGGSPAPASMPQPGDRLPPEAHSPHVGGNVVRLELFLSAEQLSLLFRAIMAGQHTVMTEREAASYLRIPKESLVRYAEDGEIPGVLVDGRWRFPKAQLDEWLNIQRLRNEDTDDAA